MHAFWHPQAFPSFDCIPPRPDSKLSAWRIRVANPSRTSSNDLAKNENKMLRSNVLTVSVCCASASCLRGKHSSSFAPWRDHQHRNKEADEMGLFMCSFPVFLVCCFVCCCWPLRVRRPRSALNPRPSTHDVRKGACLSRVSLAVPQNQGMQCLCDLVQYVVHLHTCEYAG